MIRVPLAAPPRIVSHRSTERPPQRGYFLVRPPYEEAEHFTRFEPARGGAAVPGAVVGMRLEDSGSDWSTLAGEIRQLRLRLIAACENCRPRQCDNLGFRITRCSSRLLYRLERYTCHDTDSPGHLPAASSMYGVAS
jgi:hypothetical protein